VQKDFHPRRGRAWLQGPGFAVARAWACIGFVSLAVAARAQSPELTMRDFSSGQIKKGVRSIGFGGDGATWGNYGLVWKDASTALVDYGNTKFDNGNDFHFSAIGLTSPSLWHDAALYVIVMSQEAGNILFDDKSPAFGRSAVPVVGGGSDHAVFSKIAMPLGNGVSAGVLLSYETSGFDTSAIESPGQTVHYQTTWRPSGGFGIAWQPSKMVLVGLRALLNNDFERRTDPVSLTEGTSRSQEYRVGASYSPWGGALLDAGGTFLKKQNGLTGARTTLEHPNIGFEQAVWDRRYVIRFGVDETSPTAGFSVKVKPLNLDFAYVHDMARARVGDLFGRRSESFVMTLTLNYAALMGGR
jgi:hypothetical protein